MEIVAIVAGGVSIILGLFAIWQSDKVNKDTIARLARIDAVTTSTKDEALAESHKWNELARDLFKKSSEINKANEEKKKLREEMRDSSLAKTNELRKSVPNDSAESLNTSKIMEKLDKLDSAILKIQDRTIVEIEKADKRSRISSLLANASPDELVILRAVCRNPNWTTLKQLEDLGYKYDQMRALDLAGSLALLWSESYEYKDMGEVGWDVPHWVTSYKYRLDPDLCEALQR